MLVKKSTLNFSIYSCLQIFWWALQTSVSDTSLPTFDLTYRTYHILSGKSCAKNPQFSDFEYVQDQFVQEVLASHFQTNIVSFGPILLQLKMADNSRERPRFNPWFVSIECLFRRQYSTTSKLGIKLCLKNKAFLNEVSPQTVEALEN